ncbi:MAG: MBL fold metallo-hydrolase [Veillonellales bacterium]
MKVIKLQVGYIGTNCYIAYCEKTLQAAIIDPGGNAEEISAALNRNRLSVAYIINTHGHADHILANDTLRQATGAPVLIHQQDADMLTNAQRNLSMFISGSSVAVQPADRLLAEGELIHVGSFTFKVLYTPGHTPGGISLLTEDVVFCGDTLFAESVGRTDFPGGSYSQLIASIKEKLLVLPDEIKVLPGHGPATTIGWERKMNSFIQ